MAGAVLLIAVAGGVGVRTALAGPPNASAAASAASVASRDGASSAASVAGAPYLQWSPALHIPPLLADNTDRAVKNGQQFAVTQTTGKVKVTIDFPKITVLAYTSICSREFTSDTNTCVDKSFLGKYPKIDAALGMYGAYGPVWVQSPTGSPRPFGYFPTVHVQALAFGTVPVSATVVISQPLAGTYLTPLNINFAAYAAPVAPGTVVPGLGTAPDWPNDPGANSFVNFPSTVEGPIDVALRDLRIDQQPVPLNRSCQTRGSRLHLFSREGFDDSNSSPQRGKPGEYAIGGPPGYLEGNATIGAFTGCRVTGRAGTGEDLDRLLTSFISGSDNPVNSTELSGLFGGWCAGGVGSIDCDPYDDGQVTPQLARRDAAPSIPAATLRPLPPALRHAVLRTFGPTAEGRRP